MPSGGAQTITPVISIINMKGGVGKTTITGNVFREVFRRKGKRTLLIDFDPQFNLSQLLLTQAVYENLKAQKKTIWYVMEPEAPNTVFSVSANSNIKVADCDTYTYILRALMNMTDVKLRLLPGDFQMTRLNLRDNNSALRIPRARFHSFIDKAKQSYDIIALDCNPSSSFLTQIAIEVSTHLLIPVRLDKYSILGIQMLNDYIEGLPNLRAKPKSIILINDFQQTNPDADRIIQELRGHTVYGPQTLVESIPHTSILAARADYTGFAVDRRVPYSGRTKDMLGKVADELTSRIGVV